MRKDDSEFLSEWSDMRAKAREALLSADACDTDDVRRFVPILQSRLNLLAATSRLSPGVERYTVTVVGGGSSPSPADGGYAVRIKLHTVSFREEVARFVASSPEDLESKTMAAVALADARWARGEHGVDAPLPSAVLADIEEQELMSVVGETRDTPSNVRRI